jgi:hypothetical protein
MTGVEEGFVLLALLGLLGWYWLDSVGARDVALAAAQRACREAEVQLLDHSVARHRIRLLRNREGRISICRVYSFEFATDGERRYRGLLALLGKQVEEVRLEPYRIDAPAESAGSVDNYRLR